MSHEHDVLFPIKSQPAIIFQLENVKFDARRCEKLQEAFHKVAPCHMAFVFQTHDPGACTSFDSLGSSLIDYIYQKIAVNRSCENIIV